MTERVELRNMTAITPTSRVVGWKHPVSAGEREFRVFQNSGMETFCFFHPIWIYNFLDLS